MLIRKFVSVLAIALVSSSLIATGLIDLNLVFADRLPESAKGAATEKPQGVIDANAWQRDVDAYKKLVTDLSSPEMEGRGPGTKGLDKARDYLVNELEKLNLEPAFADTSKTGKRDAPLFTQEFQIPAGAKVIKQELVLADSEGKQILKAAAGDTFSPRGFSSNGKFKGQAVFVGYGITNKQKDHDDYASFDNQGLKGKIAVAYRYEPMSDEGKTLWVDDARFGQWSKSSSLLDKAKWAAAKGASALLVVDPPSKQKEGRLPTAGETQARSQAPIPVIQIKPEVFRAMLRQHGEGEQSFAKTLQQRANKGPVQPLMLNRLQVKGEIELDRKAKFTVHNVAGYLPGWGKLKDEIIVLGAHYDHLGYGGMSSLARNQVKDKSERIHHGADDNGSGTAALVMLARRLVEFDRAPSGPLRSKDSLGRRTVLVCFFTAEERGLLGSAHMLRYPEQLHINGKTGKEGGIKPMNMSIMLNMDMVGRMKDNKLLAVGTGTGDKFKSMVLEAGKGMDLKINPEARATGGSDQMSFHIKKIPAIHFFTGAHKDYHKPTDTAEKINYEGATKTVALLSTMVLNYWQNDVKVNYIKARMAHPASGGPRGSGAYLGVIPNYASLNAEDGCAIDGVSDNSPAEAAGLKGDDIIVRWDKMKINNLRDLTEAIARSKPGQKVALTIIRNKKEQKLTVKLGTRG